MDDTINNSDTENTNSNKIILETYDTNSPKNVKLSNESNESNDSVNNLLNLTTMYNDIKSNFNQFGYIPEDETAETISTDTSTNLLNSSRNSIEKKIIIKIRLKNIHTKMLKKK